MSIKVKLIVLLCTILGAGGAAMVIAIRQSFAGDAQMVADASVKEAVSSFKTLTEGERAKLAATLAAISNDRRIIDAWSHADRAALQGLTTDAYKIVGHIATDRGG